MSVASSNLRISLASAVQAEKAMAVAAASPLILFTIRAIDYDLSALKILDNDLGKHLPTYE